jgi:hypothetical protein
VGSAGLGVQRPDVGQAFGSQFANSGFALVGSLPVGNYRLVAYMHDVLTNSFNLSQSASITVSGPAMAIDIPNGTNTPVTAGASIVGWAIDPAAPSGTGVDAVHVWAFPSAGGAPIFVGSASLGIPRPDVGAIFGSQFTNSGYFQTLGGLPPGGYTLGVYAHSTVTNSFSQARFVTIVYQ